MAGCYHNQEELESDLTIEVAREDDILKEGQGLHEFECKKNPGHRDFIPFKDLTLQHLPSRHRNTETLDYLKQIGSRVVRLVVAEKILGSGYVFRINNQYHIKTNNHVVKTEDDVKRCKVEFHYDDDSELEVFRSTGVELCCTDPYRDFTNFKFQPVPDFLHQLDYKDNREPYINIMLEDNQIEMGLALSKRDSYLALTNLNAPNIYLMFISYLDGSIGYFDSCYFLFEPIPSNTSTIQELTSVEVNIDEDDDTSRKMKGIIVNVCGGFGVKVPDSITQDKVKKCRVMWNDKLIGRGTRLYFKHRKYKDYYSPFAIEEELIDRDMWEFNFHPKKVQISEERIQSDDMCCISHPHGAIKQITFGRELGHSQEKFDNQHNLKTIHGSDCQCKMVHCLNYSCKTCPGSSGSPVFRLWELDGDSYRTHFMSKGVSNGEQIENINIAWIPGIFVRTDEVDVDERKTGQCQVSGFGAKQG